MRRSEGRRMDPRNVEQAAEAVHFRPELISWWNLLGRYASPPGASPKDKSQLGLSQRWMAADHPAPSLRDQRNLQQRSIPTLALCLAGTARIAGIGGPCDLLPGESLLIAPGAWHHHVTPRPGCVVYRQGFILGRSDFFLMDARLHLVATIPEQPSRRCMIEMLLEPDEALRRIRLTGMLAAALREAATPRSFSDPAVLAMLLALQNTLHVQRGTEAALRASGLSRAQAYRCFQSTMGTGIASVRRHMQHELAAWLRLENIPEAEITKRGGRG